MNTIRNILYLLIAKLPTNLRDDIRGIKRYRAKKRVHPEKQLLIFCVDGTTFHGGLCDRFKGAVTLFHYCLCKNIQFRINYMSPFELTGFLLPNEYDWQLSENEEITSHVLEAKYLNILNKGNVKQLIKLNTKRQIHAYTNLDFVEALNQHYKTNYNWGELFKKLFKPTEELTEKIVEYQKVIGGKYICVHLRFQNLLGDFEDNDTKPLSNEEINRLISLCKKEILNIQKEESIKKVYVTSDSISFLKNMKSLESIYVFPQKTVHIDIIGNENLDVYMKSFVDFYLLSAGEKIYSIGTSQMYKSDFPLYAAKLNNTPFEQVNIN